MLKADCFSADIICVPTRVQHLNPCQQVKAHLQKHVHHKGNILMEMGQSNHLLVKSQ